MARRVWLVRADQQVGSIVGDGNGGFVDGPPIDCVSQQALLKAMVDGGICADRLGGVLAVTLYRVPTGVPGEHVTQSAMVEWKDRGDARAQPEVPVAEPERVAVANGALAVDHLGEEVDVSEVPPEMRGL